MSKYAALDAQSPAQSQNSTPVPPSRPALDVALSAFNLGLRPVPPCEDGSKAPFAWRPTDRGPTWKHDPDQPATEADVKAWFARGRASIGLQTGVEECFEFDEGPTYWRFLNAATDVGLGDLIARIRGGYEETTPGGGVHWLYRTDEVRGNKKLAQRHKTPDELNADDLAAIETAKASGKEHHPIQCLIETRGEGGFIIIAPSNGRVHPSGGAYVLKQGSLATIVTITGEERDALWSLAEQFHQIPDATPPVPAPKTSRDKRLPDVGVSVIDDFNARVTWADVLDPFGWKVVKTHGTVTTWRRPGKAEGQSATTGYCGDRLKVFTSSTCLGTEKTHSKFATYSALNHGDNFSDTVKALAQQGYGTWIDEDGTEKQNPSPKDWKRKKTTTSIKAKPEVVEVEKGDTADDINATDLGNARRLARLHGHDLRYCAKMGRWFIWDGTRWRMDEKKEIVSYATDVIRAIHGEAAEADGKELKDLARWAISSESDYAIKSMISLASTLPGIGITTDELDRDPWLLNTPSGTVNLRTGEVQPCCRKHLITKITTAAIDLKADCPRWKKVLLEIMDGDQAMVDYLQRALGYCLTGDVSEHALWLCYGSGRNGKNTIMDAIKELLGDYAWVVDPKCFLAGNDGHLTALAALTGRRFVPTDEVDDGEKMAEGLIKRVTGNKTLNARFMRQDGFEFPIQFKLWFACNHKPEIKGTDEGIWSRVRLIPFKVYFPPEKRIKGLSSILVKEEGPAIMGWLSRGCQEWLRVGLSEPESVLAATKGYRSEQDVLSAFIAECCVDHRDHPNRDQFKTTTSELYDAYSTWAKAGGEKNVLTSRRFGSAMEDKGFAITTPTYGKRSRTGVLLAAPDADTRGGRGEEEPCPF